MTERTRPSVERLRELLEYDPETGLFTHRIGKKGTRSGTAAGYVSTKGYVYITVDAYETTAQQVAWAMQTGQWPPRRAEIDHKNGVKTDNRWENIRLATRSENARNSGVRKNNTSGFKGVSFNARKGRWMAYITLNYKQHFLGYYDSPEEAHAAYCKAAHELHGEFARTA